MWTPWQTPLRWPGRLHTRVAHAVSASLAVAGRGTVDRCPWRTRTAQGHVRPAARLPGDRRWQHGLLADGNIGVSGDPVLRPLRRERWLLRADGRALVKVEQLGGARWVGRAMFSTGGHRGAWSTGRRPAPTRWGARRGVAGAMAGRAVRPLVRRAGGSALAGHCRQRDCAQSAPPLTRGLINDPLPRQEFGTILGLPHRRHPAMRVLGRAGPAVGVAVSGANFRRGTVLVSPVLVSVLPVGQNR